MPKTIAYFIEHVGGFRTTLFLATVRDFNYAGLLGDGRVVSCQMYLPMPGIGIGRVRRRPTSSTRWCGTSRTSSWSGGRTIRSSGTLLTSGMVIAAVDSLHRGQVPVETPEMAVSYQAPRGSFYCRD